MVHVRLAGRSYDLDPRTLGLNPRMSDDDIKLRLAQHFDIAREQLNDYVVDRRPDGVFIIRPEAVYG